MCWTATIVVRRHPRYSSAVKAKHGPRDGVVGWDQGHRIGTRIKPYPTHFGGLSSVEAIKGWKGRASVKPVSQPIKETPPHAKASAHLIMPKPTSTGHLPQAHPLITHDPHLAAPPTDRCAPGLTPRRTQVGRRRRGRRVPSDRGEVFRTR